MPASTAGTNLNLIDFAKQLDPDGTSADIAELLSATNEMLEDMTWKQGNLPTGDRATFRSDIPAGTWGRINQGTAISKSTTEQIDFACGFLEARAAIDMRLLDLYDDEAKALTNLSRAFIEGMSQQAQTAFLYENQANNSERITGLAPYYSTMVTANAPSGRNVLQGGGSGNTNTSVYLIVWDENTITGVIPKNGTAGLNMRDLKEQRVLDAAGNPYQARELLYKWDMGLEVLDWRYGVRICNIDVAALTKNAATGADLIDLMTQAIEQIDNIGRGKAAFYCNRTVRSFLRRQMNNKSNVWLSREEIAGKRCIAFDGIPIRRVDMLLNTEATVT